MSRIRLDRTIIFSTSAELAEEVGLENITLLKLANKLGVKTPSLYNHINGLKDMYIGLAKLGLERLGDVVRNAAVGKSNDEAIASIAYEYRKFAKQCPELYKAIIKSPELNNSEIKEAAHIPVQIMCKVLEGYKYSEEDAMHITRGLRSTMHGFVSLEAAGFFKSNWDREESYKRLVSGFILSIRK
jgi:AcrR family transcriptional regulator